MFIKTRCLLIVSEEIKNSQSHGVEIREALEHNHVYDYFFQNVTNKESLNNFLNMLPCGTIFSESLSKKSEALKYYISLPMFSSHFSQPIKEGEFIWVYPYDDFEDSSNSSYYNIVNSYWISRIHSFFQTEDLNYNYNDRDYIVNSSINKYSKALGSRKNRQTAAERRKSKELDKKIENSILRQYTSRSDFFNNNSLDALELINNRKRDYDIKNIPRYFSKREDFSISGSNNTLINLGTNINNDNPSY